MFTLKHAPDSEGERLLPEKARDLATIPAVQNFERLRQVSPQCGYTFGLSMEFADQAAYDACNNHPLHQSFVEKIWLEDVSACQEIDYEPLFSDPSIEICAN